MTDGRSEGGRDWRRKLSASSASTKPSSKDASRAKNGKAMGNDAGLSTPINGRPTNLVVRPSTASSSTSKSTPSSRSRPDTDSLTPSTPTSMGPSGGFRTNIFRSGKERSSGANESAAADRRKLSSAGSSPREAKLHTGRERSLGELIDPGVGRSLSDTLRDAQSPSPHEITSGDPSGEEDVREEGRRDGKRGSVIEKVAQKAKLVLPRKRAKELGKSESSRSLAAKSTASSSSMQSSPRLDLPIQGEDPDSSSTSSPEEDEDEDEDEDEIEEENQDEDEANGVLGIIRSRAGSSPRDRAHASTDEDGGLSPTSPARRDVHKPLSSPDEDTPGKHIVRPQTVPPRPSRPEDLSQSQSSSSGKASTRKARPAEKVAGASKAAEAAKESSPRTLPLRNQKSVNSLHPARQKKPSMNSIREVSLSASHDDDTGGISSPRVSSHASAAAGRPSALRGTSAMKMSPSSTAMSSKANATPPVEQRAPRRAQSKPPTFEPPLLDAERSGKVDPAPPTGMYWSKAPCYGYDHAALRAHTTTLIGSNIYVFGGCDAKACFNELYVFDADCMFWQTPECTGDLPPPLRAMTATAVGKKIVIFGGGDGATYCNDVYILDTLSFRYTKAVVSGGSPCKRRAHTACLQRNGLYVFGGGDGERALNDVWKLDVSDMTKLSWRLISPPSKASNSGRPTARGYHTANMVGTKMIIFGGSDGVECFRDVWIFDVDTQIWRFVDIKLSYPRLSHSATVVGSYLFVIGGHDGVEYSSDVLLLNLVTMQWDRRKTYGSAPTGRGYHGTVLHDSRLFSIGGFDGNTVFDDTYVLELAVSAYFSQISHFTIDV